MAEYINRNALLEALCGNDASNMEDYYYNAIKDFPATDVAPVVHGKWISKEDDFFSERTWACSACDTWFVLEDGTPKENEYNHCPHCGAKMDG